MGERFNPGFLSSLAEKARKIKADVIGVAAAGILSATEAHGQDKTHVEDVAGQQVEVDEDGLIAENSGPDSTNPNYGGETKLVQKDSARLDVKPERPSSKAESERARQEAQHEVDWQEVSENPGEPNPDKPAKDRVASN